MRYLEKCVHGNVQLKVTGKNAERFFQLCAGNGIPIWELQRTGTDEYLCHMTRRGVWDSRPYYHKTGVHSRILQKKGLPFFLFRYRRRILFPLALCAVIFLFGYCSQFIWRIELTGNSSLTEERVLSYLEDLHASTGARKSDIDCEQLELSLREDFDEVIWASVAIEGTSLIIALQEKNHAAQETSYEESLETDAAVTIEDGTETGTAAWTLVAAKDAVIESIVVRRGLAAVKAQDEVLAGEVLVRGRQEVLDDNGETKFWYVTEPDADIIGVVTYTYSDVIPETISEKICQEPKLLSVYFQLPNHRFTLSMPWKADENQDILESYYQLHITAQFYLPLGIGWYQVIPTQETERVLTKDEALALAESRLQSYLSDLEENGVLITEKNVTMSKVGEEYQVSGTITALEAIGVLAAESPSELDTEGIAEE